LERTNGPPRKKEKEESSLSTHPAGKKGGTVGEEQFSPSVKRDVNGQKALFETPGGKELHGGNPCGVNSD